MKKVILAAFVMLGMTAVVQAGPVAGGSFHDHKTSSGVVFSGAGTLMKVHLSSVPATQAFNSLWVQYFDTAAYQPAGGVSYSAFTTTQSVTVPLMMSSSGTITLTPDGGGRSVDFGPNGVFVNNGLYLYFVSDAAGTGVRVQTYWRRED